MASSFGKASESEFGDRNLRKYQEESTKVSIVSVSRLAAPPHFGQDTFTQSDAPPSGEVPFGERSKPLASGRRIGSSLAGTGTSPHLSQCTIGIGVPQ